MQEYSKDGIAFTRDKDFAERYKVKDNTNIHFVKNERYKQYLKIHGSRKKLYKKIQNYYVLPPSVGRLTTTSNYVAKLPDRLYARQREAVEQVVGYYNNAHKSCFLVSGTGTGKGVLAPAIIDSFHDRKILLLAPNNVVALRLMEDLVGVAKYSRGKKILKELDNRVVVTLYKTFNLYFEELNKNYDIVIIDE